MVSRPRFVSKSKYVPFIITLCLVTVIFLLSSNIHSVKVTKLVETSEKTYHSPGEYLKYVSPSKGASYCKLNYGLPTQLIYSKEDIFGSPEIQLNSSFRILYNVIEGQLEKAPGVTYVTHMTKGFVFYLAEVARYWEGPISVAAYIPDGDPKVILESVLHLCYCEPQMSRVSLHLVFRKDLALSFYLSKLMPPVRCDLQEISIQQSANMNIQPSNDSNITNNWYPINVCRNAARQAALTEYVLVCDVELMPSQGLASRFIDMTESYKCLEPETCQKRVFVVPVFEVENTEELPRNKQQLVQLMEQSKAVYFHQLSCVHCQKFPGLEQWKESDSGDLIKPLIETKREVPYHRWEPIYIGTKQEPMYFEQLSWEGFQDKMLQMHEMCLAGYNLVVLDGAFLVHWPGIKKAKRKDEPWRLPYVKMNQRYYDTLLRNITKRYHPNPQCSLKKP